MTSRSYESGIQPYRLEFVRESTIGTAPSDPSWELFSDNARTFEPSFDSQISAQQGLGDPDNVNSFAGTEQNELTVTYDLQRWLLSSGSANDASYDGVNRDSDNRLGNTHTVVRRQDIANLDAGNTINGSTSLDTRLYFVGHGGKIDEVTYTANIEENQPVSVELSYMFEHGRLYQIDQPSSSTTIDVISSNANDSGTVTIEDEGASTSEDISITAGGTATSSSSFGDIDAISIDSEQPGDITISDGTNDLAVIYGQNHYDQGEGDLGIPALGTGSHASAVGTEYELPLDGDAFELPDGTDLADHIVSNELSFSNNVEARPNPSGARPRLVEQGRDVEVSATVFGQVESYNQVTDMQGTVVNNYRWTFSDPAGDSGNIDVTNMTVTEASHSEEARQDVSEVDVTLAQQEGVTVT